MTGWSREVEKDVPLWEDVPQSVESLEKKSLSTSTYTVSTNNVVATSPGTKTPGRWEWGSSTICGSGKTGLVEGLSLHPDMNGRCRWRVVCDPGRWTQRQKEM